ncbi:unnamed protein product (macronuclear) [Paramecium tetraurelia]|uniref:Uncharacterized protein n=1 Tax=Paramecium tetraurelia TaxID=5888 RepID=A0CG64_PARTE|nr:uncharacterized protein GSPATT00038225001 [Paramecium tetraurelia]CAK69781.1 unnamed protein product [Paramecium tetraurelia]|eukprot:XP_001437178.1 hypothetical protein (macronuclear) [Paramecium tetraurelia strain d4-2]
MLQPYIISNYQSYENGNFSFQIIILSLSSAYEFGYLKFIINYKSVLLILLKCLFCCYQQELLAKALKLFSYITVDDALSDLLKTQPKGYKPWHPSLNVRLRVQEEERTQEFYSFVQQQIKIKQRGINTQHPMQLVQVQGPEFFENLVCKCSFSPAEAAQEEEEGGEGGGEEAEGGACEAEGSGEGGEGEGEGEEVEFIVKKTKAHGKDFSFLQVGTQSNLNQYIPQTQQVDQLSQYDQRLQAQELLIKQFMEKQNQLTQQISMLQQGQGVFVPSLFPQVVDPNFLTPQQQAQLVYMMQLQQQQQQIQQQLLQQQMLNPLSFQSSPTIVKNDNAQTQQFQVPFQQTLAYTQPITQPIINPQILLQQQILQQQQLNQQQIPQQLNQQQLLQQQQQLLNQQQIPQAQPQQMGQSQIHQQIPQFQQQQIPSTLTQSQQQFQGIPQQSVQQQIPQQVQFQNIQQQTYQQIPQQQVQQQIPQLQQQVQQQQNGFLQQPQQQQQPVPQFDQLLAQQMTQPLMQPQFLQKQPQIIGGR